MHGCIKKKIIRETIDMIYVVQNAVVGVGAARTDV